MARTAKRLFGPGLLTAAAVTKYTVPTSTKTIIRHFRINNVTASAANVTISIGADAAGTEIVTALSIASNSIVDHYGYWVMDAAEILQALSGTASAINLSAYGDEITLG